MGDDFLIGQHYLDESSFSVKKTPRPFSTGERKAAEILVLLTAADAAGRRNVFKRVFIAAGYFAAAFYLGIIDSHIGKINAADFLGFNRCRTGKFQIQAFNV